MNFHGINIKVLLVPFRIEMSGKNFRVTHTSERTNADGKPVKNKLLLAAPDNEYELLRADLTYVDLPDHLSLHEPTQNIEFVYFPNRGMVSQVVVTKDGRTVEVGLVGNEGYVGAGLAAGLRRVQAADGTEPKREPEYRWKWAKLWGFRPFLSTI